MLDKLKKILYEMEYIYYIYDDVKNLYLSLDDKDDIYKLYNNNDLLLLYLINSVCKQSVFFKCNKNLDFHDFNELINDYNITYSDLKTIDIKTISLKYIFEHNDFFKYNNKEYIYIVKEDLNTTIYKVEKLCPQSYF